MSDHINLHVRGLLSLTLLIPSVHVWECHWRVLNHRAWTQGHRKICRQLPFGLGFFNCKSFLGECKNQTFPRLSQLSVSLFFHGLSLIQFQLIYIKKHIFYNYILFSNSNTKTYLSESRRNFIHPSIHTLPSHSDHSLPKVQLVVLSYVVHGCGSEVSTYTELSPLSSSLR